MRKPSLFRFASRWRAFRRADDGNVAITFAASLVPLVGLMGMAIDYSRANRMLAAMQAAVDSTALAVSKDAPSQTASVLQSTADTYFRALFTSTDALDLVTQTTYTATPNPQVVVTATASIKPRFLSMNPWFGLGPVPLKASTTTTWGSLKLRVALALDNTGSMADDGKMDALKTATKNLLTQLKAAAASNGDVYVSIIPFSHDVNVGSSNYTASWLDWTEYGSCSHAPGGGSQYETKGKCVAVGGTWTTYSSSARSSWNGCVTDRGNSSGPNPSTAGLGYDQIVDAPGSTSQSKFPAHQDAYCPLAMKGLNYDWTAMNTMVDSMYPKGSTNQPLGLVWAWQSLVGGGPLTVPAYDTNYDYQHVIILLSDGLNTADRWYGNGSAVSTQVDARMYDKTNSGAGTCDNIKKAKINTKWPITIYTIQVNTGGDPTSTLLQSCASNSPGTTDHFYMLTNANQIITTFQQIGTKLSQLRIAK
jgi:Flp pilus assembly protein TadG